MPPLQISLKHIEAFRNIHPTLLEVLRDVEQSWPFTTPIRITSFNRTWQRDREVGGSGVHAAGPPWRAIDIGTRGLSQQVVKNLCYKLNNLWTYDPERATFVVAYCAEHGTGPHIHLQVHPRTRRAHIGEDVV